MSILNRKSNQSVHSQAIDGISSIISNSGASITTKELAGYAASLESIDDHSFSQVSGAIQSIRHDLEDSHLGAILQGRDPLTIDLALEAAALTILAGGDAISTHNFGGVKPQSVDNGILVNPSQGGADYNSEYSLEAFDPSSLQRYIAQSAYANAMAVVGGGFEEVFFPTQLVPAGTNGVDVKVIIPKVFSSVTRTSNGVPTAFTKHSIISALIDSSILDSDSTDVIPYASSTTLPASLVTDAIIPTTTRVIDGNDIDTRPILFGQSVDLIALSSAPALIAGGTFDETDALDTVINMGKVYFRLETTTARDTVPVITEVIISVDVSGQIGSLFTQTSEGSSRDFQANLLAKVIIDETLEVVVGDAAAMVTILEGILGIGAGVDFDIVGELSLSGTANTETSVMEVFANRFDITESFDAAGNAISITPFDTTSELVTLTAVGYVPDARRTNSNIRTKGTIIDSTGSVTYRFPIPLGAPFISQNAIGAPANTSVEGLGHAQRIRNNNNAVKALLNMEALLDSGNGIPVNSPAMGSEMVTPTIVRPATAIDVAAVVATLSSKDALSDLRGTLVAAVTNVANEMILKSGYLAALEFVTGSNDGFEVIVVTDTHIAAHLLSDGEERTLGNGIKLRVTQSLNSSFKGKIYISLRRTVRDGISPLDFGSHLFTPALTYDAQVSRGGSTVVEQHHVPRNAYYATLPILGVIEVVNLDTIFTT